MSSHKLDQADSILRAERFSFCTTDRTLGLFDSSVKPKTAIDKGNVLIDRLCNATYCNASFALSRFNIELIDSAVGAIAADNYALRSSSHTRNYRKGLLITNEGWRISRHAG